MFIIYVTILFFGYLWFVRRNESIGDRNFREGNFIEIFPHRKNGLWRWNKFVWLDVVFYICFFILLLFVFIN